MSNIHAKDTARHIADNANEIAALVIKDSELVLTSSSSKDQILSLVEHGCVKHRWRLRLEDLHVIIIVIEIKIFFFYQSVVLVQVGLTSIDTIPLICSNAFINSQVKELKGIVVSIASCQNCIPIISEIDGITTTNVRTQD